MTAEDSIHSQRLRALREAERLGNVSEARRRHGLSRTVFYRLRPAVRAVRPRWRASETPPGPARSPAGGAGADGAPRDRVRVGLADLRAAGYSDQLAREGVTIAAVTIWRLLRRRQLGARLAVLEQCSVTTGLLTERTAKPIRHVEAAQPGDLLSLDTFYVGKLKGVGKHQAASRVDERVRRTAAEDDPARALAYRLSSACTLPVAGRSKVPSVAFCSSTTRSGPIAGIDSVDGRRPPSLKVRSPHEPVNERVNALVKLDRLGAAIGITIGAFRYPFNKAFDVYRGDARGAPKTSAIAAERRADTVAQTQLNA